MGRSTPALLFFHQKHGVPHLALISQTALSLILVATTTFDSLLKYTAIALSICTMLTVAGVFMPRFRAHHAPPRHTFLAATIFLAMTAFIIVRSIIAEPLPSLLGFATVLLATLLWIPLKKSNT